MPVSGLALAESRLYRLTPDRFWDMVGACPGILRKLVRTVAERYQTFGENTEQQMRLVALGTMAAGLAHELNNPASAARRAASDLEAALRSQARASLELAARGVPQAGRAALEGALPGRGAPEAGAPQDALARADRAEELALVLEREDVADAVALADALADAGVDAGELGALLGTLPAGARPAAAAWTWTCGAGSRTR